MKATAAMHEALDKLYDEAEQWGANLDLFDIVIHTVSVDQYNDAIVTHTDFRAELTTVEVEEMSVSTTVYKDDKEIEHFSEGLK